MNEPLIQPVSPTVRQTSTATAATEAGRKLRHAAVVAGLLVVAAAIGGLVPRWRERAALRAETSDLAMQTVSVVSPSPAGPGVSLELPAEIKPFLEAPIYARATGYLKRWLLDIGAQVKEGDLLAEIDTPELNQELAQARAQSAQAEAALALARTTAARWAELLKTASVSEQEAAEKDADLQLKLANLQAAQANVSRLEEMKGFQMVRAPFAGVITARDTDVGQLITAGSSHELFRLAQTGTLRVYARVPEAAAAGVAAGQMAELTIPELPGRVFSAKIVRTSGAMSADSRTLLTEMAVDNSKGEIFAGSYAQVRFTETKAGPALTLPSNALLFRSEGTQVGVVRSNGIVELRKVALGRDFGPTLEIVSGVDPHDRVIVNPPDSLVSGASVRVVEEGGPAPREQAAAAAEPVK
jgi:RND family efflux transporter MFP subunit